MPLSLAEKVLFEKVRHDPTAREQAIAKYLPMARRIARSFRVRDELLEDITQVAIYGLIEAIDDFDPSRNVPFMSYAYPKIKGRVKKYFRDHTWFINPPRKVKELFFKVDLAKQILTQQNQAEPSVYQVACFLKETVETIQQTNEATHLRIPYSLEAPLVENTDGEPLYMEDLIPDDSQNLAEEPLSFSEKLEFAYNSLDPKSKKVINLRFIHELSQSLCGQIIGCSQMNVHRLEVKALNKMREKLKTMGVTSPKQLYLY